MKSIKKQENLFEVILSDDTSFLITEEEKNKIMERTNQFIITKKGEVFNRGFIKKIIRRRHNITQIAKEIIAFFNKKNNKNYKVIDERGLDYWLNTYSVEEIKRAIEFVPTNNYWVDKMDLIKLFDIKNDYIGQLLNTPKPTQQENENQASFLNRLEIWRKLQVKNKV